MTLYKSTVRIGTLRQTKYFRSKFVCILQNSVGFIEQVQYLQKLVYFFLWRGQYAVVRRCIHKETGKEFAAKFVRKRRKGKDCRAEVWHEVEVLRETNFPRQHSKLITLYEIFETRTELILVLELYVLIVILSTCLDLLFIFEPCHLLTFFMLTKKTQVLVYWANLQSAWGRSTSALCGLRLWESCLPKWKRSCFFVTTDSWRSTTFTRMRLYSLGP